MFSLLTYNVLNYVSQQLYKFISIQYDLQCNPKKHYTELEFSLNMNNNNQQLAALPRRSGRLATIIPASHWISMGYSQVQATAMEELQHDIIKTICDEQDSETEIKLQARGTLILARQFLPHNDLMLPHGKKFANGLSRRASVVKVQIGGIHLPAQVSDIIFPALQSMNNLNNLTLYRTGHGEEGYQRLSSFLNEENTRLEKLAIVQNVIDDLSAARVFSHAVKNHAALKRLMMDKCGLNNIPILTEVLEGCRGIEALGIIWDGFGSEGVALIANFIRSNKTIEKLRFDGSKFTDNDVDILLASSKENTNLRQLDLKKNNITEEGENKLLKAMFDPTSMDSIIESNHILQAFTFDITKPRLYAQRPLLEQEVLRINKRSSKGDYTIQQTIRKKVVLALCGVDGGLFDLSHFNDLPLGVMPRVLELIQEHGEARTHVVRSMPGQLEKDALSRLFHTLRGWELPLLFENLRIPCSNVDGGKRKRRKTRR